MKTVTLSQAIYNVCPNADPKCILCRLSIEDLKKIHSLRFDKKFTYKQLMDYLKYTHNIGNDRTLLSKHFRTHVKAHVALEQKLSKRKKSEVTEVSKAIDTIPKEKRSVANKDLETAYTTLTKLAQDFTQKVYRIYDTLDLDDKTIKKQLKDVPAIEGLSAVAKLSKEARELITSLSSLRAPKIVVARFLEQAVDEIISETGFVLSDISKNMQEDLLEAIRTNKTISTDIFTKIFQGAAVEYRDRMIALRRDQLSKATATLADLEKLI